MKTIQQTTLNLILVTALLFAASAIWSGRAFASGPLDGIYDCNFSTEYGNVHSYLAINSNAQYTVVTVPNLVDSYLLGYAYGAPATAENWTGTSSYNQPFLINANSARVLGVSTVYAEWYYGSMVSVAGYCTPII